MLEDSYNKKAIQTMLIYTVHICNLKIVGKERDEFMSAILKTILNSFLMMYFNWNDTPALKRRVKFSVDVHKNKSMEKKEI